MPGNEMIHIQEGYLRLHFNISKQQHVIFTLKPLFPRNKGVWSGAQKSASPLSDWLVEGKPSGVPDPFRLWGWPPPPSLHRTLIQTRAGFALISSPQSSCQSENRGGAWTPCFGSNARLIKPTVLVSHDGGGARGDLFDTVLPSERQRDAAAKRRCYSDLQNMWFSFRSGGFHKFSSSLVLPPSVTLLRLTEGLWECEKTILGHHVDYCTSFMCRNANQPTPPPLPPLHKFSLVAVLYNTRLPNIAIRELSRSHYFEYIIILAALSHPAHHHFSPFFLCFE